MLDWDGSAVTIGGQRFRPVVGDEDPHPHDGDIMVFKTQPMMAMLADHIEAHPPATILELGMFRGGSTAFLAALAPEATVVAIDVRDDPMPALDRYLASIDGAGRVRQHLGVDQGDRARLGAIVDQEFGGVSIDLVIDDASHELERSRSSLETLLPVMSPGGCYVLEDWSWSHLQATDWGREVDRGWPQGRPLTTLVFELVVAVGSITDVVTRVDLDFAMARAWRGGAALDRETFRLRDACLGGDEVLPS